MRSMTYGYARVSTRDQHEDRQMLALTEFPVAPENIYLDKLSGKNFERPRYKRLLRVLRPGDVMVVKSIDRLGRDYAEILEQWRTITKEKRANIVVLDIPLLDTRQQNGDLTGAFIADLVLQILSYVAQTERESILQRQKEGIAAAKLRGVNFGRPPKPKPAQFYALADEWGKRMLSSREAACRCGVSQSTFIRWAAEWFKEKEGGKDEQSEKKF